ncbi:MAG: hypothetical protein P1S60_09355, partial [Anaerolineae bacterium]|nr:hypothetical protein [Anaerolineae bacterium]
MPYQYAFKNIDYSDYSSGRVLIGAPGYPAFPVRLATDIYQVCREHHIKAGNPGPYSIYDPVCGSAYMLTTISLLHYDTIQTVIGSDIDRKVLDIAQRNLSLLTLAGVDSRIDELKRMIETYGKHSHQVALESANKIRHRIETISKDRSISVRLFQANCLESRALTNHIIDIVIITPDCVF